MDFEEMKMYVNHEFNPELKQDFVVPYEELRMFFPDYLVVGGNNMHMHQWASAQLCDKLKMPIAYYRDLSQSSDEGLQMCCTENINRLVAAHRVEHKEMFIRTYDGQIRGCLSTRYTPFDTERVLEAMEDSRHNFIRECDVKQVYVGPDRFHVKMVCRNPVADFIPDVFAGFEIDTSDVGLARLSVRFLLYRQVCSNGMTVGAFDDRLFHQVHMNLTQSEFRQGFYESCEQLDHLTEAVIPLIINAKNVRIVDEMDRTTRSVVARFLRLSPDEVEAILDMPACDGTLWGLINGVTEYAQRFDLTRRIDVEHQAGRMLTDYGATHVEARH